MLLAAHLYVWAAPVSQGWTKELHLILWIGFGIAILAGKYVSGRFGNAHSVSYVIAGVLISVVGLYLTWAAFLFIKTNPKSSFVAWYLQPMKVFDQFLLFLKPALAKASKAMATKTFKPYEALFLYFIEAFGFFYYGIGTMKLSSGDLYCSSCKAWLEYPKSIAFLSVDMEDDMKETSQTGLVTWINKLNFKNDENRWIEIKGTACDSCNQLVLISAIRYDIEHNIQVHKWEIKDDRHDSQKTKETVLFKNLIVPKEWYDLLKEKHLEETELDHEEKKDQET